MYTDFIWASIDVRQNFSSQGVIFIHVNKYSSSINKNREDVFWPALYSSLMNENKIALKFLIYLTFRSELLKLM